MVVWLRIGILPQKQQQELQSWASLGGPAVNFADLNWLEGILPSLIRNKGEDVNTWDFTNNGEPTLGESMAWTRHYLKQEKWGQPKWLLQLCAWHALDDGHAVQGHMHCRRRRTPSSLLHVCHCDLRAGASRDHPTWPAPVASGCGLADRLIWCAGRWFLHNPLEVMSS